jgi:hypothetical protein
MSAGYRPQVNTHGNARLLRVCPNPGGPTQGLLARLWHLPYPEVRLAVILAFLLLAGVAQLLVSYAIVYAHDGTVPNPYECLRLAILYLKH